MSDDLRRQLRMLEDEYPDQPRVAQQADLQTINHLRARLGMPLVDDRLKEMGAADGEAKPKAAKVMVGQKEVRDHTNPRTTYQAYLKKKTEREVHREYAEQIVRATTGRGQTPVRPLATMGTGGGPLLCDHCRRPMVLEGEPFQGVNADEAWRRNPQQGWASWILGGMVVEVQINGTLRIYHGYPGLDSQMCCNAARHEDEQARARFGTKQVGDNQAAILAFLNDEFAEKPEAERLALLADILDLMFAYDPGIGVNRPATG